MKLSNFGRASGLILTASLFFTTIQPVAVNAETRTSPATPPLSRTIPMESAGRVEIGAPSSASRAGVMKSFGVRIRSLIEPGAGMAALALLAAVAAAYGVLHALGPGHQKTLITGYLLSEGGGLRTVISAASVSAASHAASVVLLFGALALLQGGLAAADGELARIIVTRLSAFILAILASRMVFIRVRSAYGRIVSSKLGAHKDADRHVHGDHAENCTCGTHDVHDHGGGEQTEGDASRRSAFSTIIAGSLVPCPGAAFFLLYGFSAGNPLAGALSVVAISAGMWATLVAVGMIAAATRNAGFQSVRSSRATNMLRSVFEVGGSLLVLGFAVALFF